MGPCDPCHLDDLDGSLQRQGRLHTAFGQNQCRGSGSCDAHVLGPVGFCDGSSGTVVVVVVVVGVVVAEAAWGPDGSVDADWHWGRTDGACDCCYTLIGLCCSRLFLTLGKGV